MNGQGNTIIQEAIEKVEHPAIATTLLDLGMLKDITATPNGKIALALALALALPLPNIPDNIRDFLIRSLESAAQSTGGELATVKLALMNEEKRQKFLTKEKPNWRV